MIIIFFVTTGCVVDQEEIIKKDGDLNLNEALLNQIDSLNRTEVFPQGNVAGKTKPIKRHINQGSYRQDVNSKNEKIHIFTIMYDDLSFPAPLESNHLNEVEAAYKKLQSKVVTELIIVEKGVGNFETYILKIVPDFSYKVRNRQITYNKLPEDFKGTYNWYNWNEEAVLAVELEDGATKSTITPERNSKKKIFENNASYCVTTITYDVWSVTTSSGTTYHVSTSSSSKCYHVPGSQGSQDASLEPPSDDLGGGGGGGGGETLDPVIEEEEIINYIEEKYKKLNDCEKSTVRNSIYNGNLHNIYKIYENSILADEKTKDFFGPNGGGNNHNDCGDAFRHAYWNALNVISTNNVPLSKQFADAHECDTPSNREMEKIMDLHNNQVGRDIGLLANNTNVANLVLQALYRGDLVVLDQVNQYNQIIPGLTEIVTSDILCN
ncbi:hypothetical protein KI659_12045 [Litoribacter alkaliphilus]|uniref:DUF6973 domain-containing protein n=1 Tax=Litoribacter ruber TaxID=702568 RepID=A0AAP2CK71_9BACT|nr:hypothetical protein [Litoribacter alkaliphilus]MBS9524741.1 hypothetical protein [Litoribacter alkaliphilus]